MVREIILSDCGIAFEEDALRQCIGSISSPLMPVNADPEPDMVDAIQPIHDELKSNVLWWVLEVIPTQYCYQDGKGWWHKGWSFHLGKGRIIPDYGPNNGPKFHVSVKECMKDEKLNYKPNAIWKTGTEVYVE